MIGYLVPPDLGGVRYFDEAQRLTPAQRDHLRQTLRVLGQRCGHAFPFASVVVGVYHRRGLLRRRRLEAVRVLGGHRSEPCVFIELYEVDHAPLDDDDPRLDPATWRGLS